MTMFVYFFMFTSAALQRMDWDLVLAARSLGGTSRRVFGTVVLPLLGPALFGAAAPDVHGVDGVVHGALHVRHQPPLPHDGDPQRPHRRSRGRVRARHRPRRDLAALRPPAPARRAEERHHDVQGLGRRAAARSQPRPDPQARGRGDPRRGDPAPDRDARPALVQARGTHRGGGTLREAHDGTLRRGVRGDQNGRPIGARGRFPAVDRALAALRRARDRRERRVRARAHRGRPKAVEVGEARVPDPVDAPARDPRHRPRDRVPRGLLDDRAVLARPAHRPIAADPSVRVFRPQPARRRRSDRGRGGPAPALAPPRPRGRSAPGRSAP